MISSMDKKLLLALNISAFVLVFSSFESNRNIILNKKSQLCFTYATKKCKFKSKDKARLICNTLVNHNTRISGIKHHKNCRKEI